jgi:hypothetical protein
MARGWESKSVESQMESAGSESPHTGRELLTPEQAAAVRKKESLLLARTRLLEQLEASSHPRHRAMLEAALAELDKLLAQVH